MEKSRYFVLFMFVVIVLSLCLVSVQGNTCTGIRLETKDGNYIFARTLEFGTDFMKFDLIAVPRNYEYTGQTPSGKPGMKWKTKYAHVGFNPFGMNLVADGLNEKGLACGSFMFPGYAGFEDVTEDDYSSTISSLDLTSWVLSSFESVSEVREQLPKIHVCSVYFKQAGMDMPLHYFITDESGDAIIVEYVDGKLNIYDNEVNAITNSPDYNWHTTNLRNYISLKASNDPDVKVDGTELTQFGQGSGAIGLPGDFTPPSRFVRATYFANVAYQGKDVDEGIGIAFHILNQFDIPRGSIRGNEAGKTVSDTTQWTSAADLKNRRYFYNTYHDRSIKMININELDLDAKEIKSIKDVQKQGEIEDVTDQLK